MITWPAPQVPSIPGALTSVRVMDTSSGQLVETVRPGVGESSMYVCGITPYDATHIGHAATYIAFDLLYRAWLDAGQRVVYTSNVTDVDDPLLERATATGVDWTELATSQITLFFDDMSALGVLPPHTYLSAVESVPMVISATRHLLESGRAYRVPVPAQERPVHSPAYDIYADVTSDPDFGSISGYTSEERVRLFADRGGDPATPGKKNPIDPIMWKAQREGEPGWDGDDLGWGRPGWHIECTTIAHCGIGRSCTVQGGGSDLIFPHHEMSSAHARALFGQDAGASVHAHAGLIAYQGEKMSKSKGNLVFVSRLRQEGVDPMAIRLAILANHYRDEWEWTSDVLDAGIKRHQLWLRAMSTNGGPHPGATLAAMREALSNDLDAPRALDAVDAWAYASLAGNDEDPGAPGVVSRAVNALLGIRL